eukprot:1905481-Rhodomonas_salina.1
MVLSRAAYRPVVTSRMVRPKAPTQQEQAGGEWKRKKEEQEEGWRRGGPRCYLPIALHTRVLTWAMLLRHLYEHSHIMLSLYALAMRGPVLTASDDRVATPPIVLRICYTMSGTDMGCAAVVLSPYAPTVRSVCHSAEIAYDATRLYDALCGTEIAYATVLR